MKDTNKPPGFRHIVSHFTGQNGAEKNCVKESARKGPNETWSNAYTSPNDSWMGYFQINTFLRHQPKTTKMEGAEAATTTGHRRLLETVTGNVVRPWLGPHTASAP